VNYFIIGDEDAVLGFGLVGVPGATATTAEEAQAAFENALSNRDNGIVIITERVADLIRTTVDRYIFSEDFPLIVEIPDRGGPLPDRPALRALVNQAIGIRV
jgi:V/A-type H+/Na+-transporting ATPase subunit F